MSEEERKETVETKEKLTTELLPPEGHPDVGRKVFEILYEILKDKENLGLPSKWKRNYELTKNKHWKRKSSTIPLVSVNLIHAHRQRTVNLLTDNNPTFNVRRVGEPPEGQDDIYEKLLRTAEFWWIDQEQQSVLEKSVINGETYGCCIEKVIFNPDLEFGLGEVEVEVIDPFYFGFYPVNCKDIQKAEAVLHFYPLTLREARRRWPKFAEKIRPDDEILKELGDDRRELQTGKGGKERGYFSTFAGVVKNFLHGSSGKGKRESDECLVVECWVKDYTMVEQKELTVAKIQGQEVEVYQSVLKPKYPGFIRCVTVCNGGELVLDDKPNPSINPELPEEEAQKTYLYDKFPFSFTQSVTDPVNPWGQSDIEQLEALNLELDKTISQFTLIKDKLSRIKIINPKNSGVANSAFTNRPGIINPTNAAIANAIRYMEPPQISPDLIKALEIYKEFFFLVAGTFELEQAHTPGRDVIAYKAIAALLEHAATMLRGKIRNYSKMIRERGRMYLSHVMNWYTEDRWINYEKDGEEFSIPIRGTQMIVPAKLMVVSGSTMPISKIQEREEAIALYEKGAIDVEELLKKLDWSNRKQVVKRMRAGPLGELLERLLMIGAPEQMIAALRDIANMDQKEFQREWERGNIPPFPALLQTEEAPSVTENLEIEKEIANIEKTLAQKALLEEQARTEQVEQLVRQAGITFDEEMLKIKRAELVANLEKQREEGKRARAEFVTKLEQLRKKSESRGTAPFREKGLKSNNVIKRGV